MTSGVEIPETGWYVLQNARLHASLTRGLKGAPDADGFLLGDIAIADGKVNALAPAARREPRPRAIDLAGRIVLPAFVDCHTHLDKGQIWSRKPNPDGTFDGALNAVAVDREARWSGHDVERRMDFGLRTAFAHGTKAIRTHLDSSPPQDAISWPVFQEMRTRWHGRIELQAACLFPIDGVRDAVWFESLVERVAAARGVLGTVIFMMPDLDQLLDTVFAAAIEHGLDLDFHTDETHDTEQVGLRRIAEAALRHGYQGRILVGHCCSLARQPDAEVLDTLDKVARSGLSVVSLPMCNMYLQDRRQDRTTPRWRGVTLVHEMAERGINVCVASDNTRDPFYAYGDLDMLEVYRMATRTLHFDHPVADWPRAVTLNPATALGIANAGFIAPGEAADLVVFKGRSWTELLSRPESDRIVIRDGRRIAADIPDYAELDELME